MPPKNRGTKTVVFTPLAYNARAVGSHERLAHRRARAYQAAAEAERAALSVDVQFASQGCFRLAADLLQRNQLHAPAMRSLKVLMKATGRQLARGMMSKQAAIALIEGFGALEQELHGLSRQDQLIESKLEGFVE